MTGPRFGCATTGFAEHRLGDPDFFGSALGVGAGCGPDHVRRAGPHLVTVRIDGADRARAELLAAPPEGVLAREATGLHRSGGPAEKRSVLRALDVLPVGDARQPLVLDALRTDDLAPVTAALATAGVEGLDAHAYRPAVLKCVAAGVPLAEMGAPRIDDELRRTPRAFAADRVAAGRPVPADVPMVLAGEA